MATGKELIQSLAQGRRIADIHRSENFERECQGGAILKYLIFLIDYIKSGDILNAPGLAIVLNEPKLGEAAILIHDRKDRKRAAEEITDPLCAKLCGGGANCIKKGGVSQ